MLLSTCKKQIMFLKLNFDDQILNTETDGFWASFNSQRSRTIYNLGLHSL